MTTKKSLSLLILSASMSVSLYAQTLTLGHAMSTDSAVHQGMLVFAERVKQRSNGELTIHISPNAEQGSERVLTEKVITGQLALAKINGSLAESYAPVFKTISIPYLFRNTAHMRTFLHSHTAQEMLDSTTDKGFRGLTFYDSGSRSFYSNKPIKTPQDMQGLTVRVPKSPTMLEMVELLGAKAIAMPYTKVYQGLKEGLVDSAENNLSSLVEMKHANVVKYYSIDQHTMTPDILIISEKVWRTLSFKQQTVLKLAAIDSLEQEIKLWDKTEKQNIAKAQLMGIHFVSVDKLAFKEKMRPIMEKARNNPDIAPYIEQIQNL